MKKPLLFTALSLLTFSMQFISQVAKQGNDVLSTKHAAHAAKPEESHLPANRAGKTGVGKVSTPVKKTNKKSKPGKKKIRFSFVNSA